MSFKSAAVKGRIQRLAEDHQAASGFKRAGIAATMRKLNDSLGSNAFDQPALDRMLGRVQAPPETLMERFTRKVEQESVDPGVAFEQELAYVKTLDGDAQKAAFGELGQLLNRRDVKRALDGDKVREYEAEIATALGHPSHEAHVELAEQVRLVLENTSRSVANRFEDAFTIAMKDRKDEQKAAFQKIAEFVTANVDDQVFVAWATGQNRGLVRTVFERAELEVPENVKQKLGMEEQRPEPEPVPQIRMRPPQRERRWGVVVFVVGVIAVGAAFLGTGLYTLYSRPKPAGVVAPVAPAPAVAPAVAPVQFNVGGQGQQEQLRQLEPLQPAQPAATGAPQIGTTRTTISGLAGGTTTPVTTTRDREAQAKPAQRSTSGGAAQAAVERRELPTQKQAATTLNTAEGIRRINSLLDTYSGDQISMSSDDTIAVTVTVGATSAQDSVRFTAGSVNTAGGYSTRTIQNALVDAAVRGLGERPASGTVELRGRWSL